MSKFLVASLFGFAVAGSASAGVNLGGTINRTHSTAAHAAHKQHLETALKDIRAAEIEAKAGRGAQAEQAIASAMRQIHAAMKHHAKNSTLHHHHHTHLTAALKDLAAAEKLLASGHAAKAEKDLEKAAVQVKDSLKQHRHTTV